MYVACLEQSQYKIRSSNILNIHIKFEILQMIWKNKKGLVNFSNLDRVEFENMYQFYRVTFWLALRPLTIHGHEVATSVGN